MLFLDCVKMISLQSTKKIVKPLLRLYEFAPLLLNLHPFVSLQCYFGYVQLPQ